MFAATLNLLCEYPVLIKAMPYRPLGLLGRIEDILAIAEDLVHLLKMKAIGFRIE